MCPIQMMKKRLIVFAALLVLLAGLCACASAATIDPLKISMELSSSSFSEPREITVSISVTNIGESDMPGPVTLYYPNGKQVEEFGSPTLSVGSSQKWSGKWNVTQKQLETGKVTFKVKYSIYNDDGELVNKTKNFSKKITYSGAVDSVEVNRTITPTTAKKDQEVVITYDIVNSGTIDITDVTIKENSSISTKKGVIERIPAGEKASYSFTATMGTKNLTSQATITYKASNKTQTVKKEAAVIKYGEVSLSASLTADKKGGNIGDTVKLTLTLKNKGKNDIVGITVKDAGLGELFTGETVAAGTTVTLEKELEIVQTQDFQFTVTGRDTNDLDVETSTSRVTVTAVEPGQEITMNVTASADRSTIYAIPGTVRFTVAVTNDSKIDLSNVSVYAVNTKLYTFPTILAGETREFTRDVSVSMAGQYAFTARCKDQLGETVSFQSNIVPIAFAEPTPVPTAAPIVTPPAPVYEEIPTTDGLPDWVGQVQDAMDVLKYVFAALAGLGAVLLAIGGVRRAQAKKVSDAAYDHMDISSRRDYVQPSDHPEAFEGENIPEKQPVEEGQGEEEAGQPEESAFDDTGDTGDVMAQALAKLYNQNEAEASEAAEPVYEEQPAYEEQPEAAYEEQPVYDEQPDTAYEQSAAGYEARTMEEDAAAFTRRRRRK